MLRFAQCAIGLRAKRQNPCFLATFSVLELLLCVELACLPEGGGGEILDGRCRTLNRRTVI